MAEDKPSWKNKDDDEGEEDVDESAYVSQKDAVLFAIEVSESMLAPPPPSDSKKAETDSPTAAAIKCAYRIMQQRIISQPKDMIGLLLFGTEKSKFQEVESGVDKGNISYPHCYLLNDLNVPSVEDVKSLKSIVEDEEEATALLEPTKDPVNMGNLLFCANQIFTTRAPDFGSRRLFIITDNDNPCAADKAARSSATVRAKDLYDLGVTIELFPISHPSHNFNRTKFYDDIIYRDAADEKGELATAPIDFKSDGSGGISLLSSLISDVNSKQVTKRSLFSNVPFEIGPDFRISVKGYNLLQKATITKGCYIYQGGETNQEAHGESTHLNEDTAGKVEKVNIKKAYKFGGTQVLFTPDEQKEMRFFGSPVIRIIGFKPQSMLPFWASVRKSTFIYPSEEHYIGSTRVFSALWQKLVKDKIMGLAWYVARSNAHPALVAILPSEEQLSEPTGVQLSPAGLWLYPLPFADDIREGPELPAPLRSPENLIDAMRKVVQQLQLPKGVYDPSKYPNPSLQWHYRILQAMALEEEIPDNPDDKTIPKYRQVEKRAGEYINIWGRILDEETRKYEKGRAGNGSVLKRERDDSEGPPSKKKIKTEAALSELSVDDMRKLVSNGKLAKHAVAELKDLLKSKGLATSGKKQELLDRVEQWIEDN